MILSGSSATTRPVSRNSKSAWRRTPTFGIVRRLQQSGIPRETATQWARLWEAEAQRRDLDPMSGEWWTAAWAWIAEQRRVHLAAQASGRADPFDPVVTVESLHRAWIRAERRSRELPPGSPESAEAMEGVNQLWEAYERALGEALGRGAFGRHDPGVEG
jgi:hypothetical protein